MRAGRSAVSAAIRIEGSQGEGGGEPLRAAVALAAIAIEGLPREGGRPLLRSAVARHRRVRGGRPRMTPVRELLDRIRWDDAFGNGRFEVDYYDRVEDTLVRAPLHRATLGDGQHFFLDLIAPDASIHSVPLHRVRAVWRDGVRIWERASPHTDGR